MKKKYVSRWCSSLIVLMTRQNFSMFSNPPSLSCCLKFGDNQLDRSKKNIIYYFAFSGISHLTLNLIFYEWISLFNKTTINAIISILANISDFGLFFVLFLLFYYSVSDYISSIKGLFRSCRFYKKIFLIFFFIKNL